MDSDKLSGLLGTTLGHLQAGALRDNSKLQSLHRSLARSAFTDDTANFKASSFGFEKSDLFSPQTVPADVSESLRSIARQHAEQGERAEFRAFVRDVPTRSAQLRTSMPAWGAGAAVDHTIGPFLNKDGRQLWFDFYKIEKLVALYIHGHPDPALLFKVTQTSPPVRPRLTPITGLATTYHLPAGSIWINSRLLAANAPAGFFTGLSIAGGDIKIAALPQIADGKLTIGPNVVVTVQLDLQQPAAPGDATSPYGTDARAAKLELPNKLTFHFSGQGGQIDQVGSAHWTLYGQEARFAWKKTAPTYNGVLQRVMIALDAAPATFAVGDCRSPFHRLKGKAPIVDSAWALPAAAIDVLNPTAAAGIGAIAVHCGAGLACSWKGLAGGELMLGAPVLMAEPGQIWIGDLKTHNLFCTQTLQLWKDAQNPFGTTAALQFPSAAPLFYMSSAGGDELLSVLTDAELKIDRPVKVTGEPPAVRSRNSLLILAANKAWRLVYLFDDNILFDNADVSQAPANIPPPMALALRNALFKVTPVSGCALFGSLADDFVEVTQGFLLLSFGVYAYLPSLPDPYAGNLGALQFQFRRSGWAGGSGQVWMLLVSMVRWQPDTAERDKVEVSFHFAPLPNQLQVTFAAAPAAAPASAAAPVAAPPSNWEAGSRRLPLPDYGSVWEQSTRPFQRDVFALLDVSTNADLLGVSFGTFYDRRMAMVTTHEAVPAASQANAFPLQVQGMDVVSQGSNVRAFTVPQISWEPVLNLTKPAIAGDPSLGPNYYPDDGGPTRILNNSGAAVALAPIPLTKFIVETFNADDKFAAAALFTLPFGIKALALLQKQYQFDGTVQDGADVLCEPKSFRTDLRGALHLRLDAGQSAFQGESNTFVGSTIQINNVLELDGSAKGASTLGGSVTKIFNNQFLLQPFNLFRQRGVPLTRIDLSGYGASTFSNWLNPNATIADTSQARFEVFVGRCAHEIIQVKSILYPWGIHVVRTITLLRAPSAYTYRWDSGWRAESDGRFDFTYFAYIPDPDPQHPGKFIPEMENAGYEIHPGVIGGLFNIKEIKETADLLPFTGQMQIKPTKTYVDGDGKKQTNGTSTDMPFPYFLQPVFFNADVEVENPISGYVTKTIGGKQRKVVPSKGILGFVQIEPRGMPLTVEALRDLVLRQGTIGGPLNCVIDIGASGQQLRVNQFDVGNSFASDGASPIFVAAARGTTILPKDGSWSVVRHESGTGEVTPVAQDLAVPLIRIGQVKRQINDLVIDPDPATQLLRIAEATEILRQPVASTVNYGFLHATDTQKALFLTPAYAAGVEKLLSKTPPLFADAFRIVNSKAIFPNIGDAVTGFGDVINLAKKGTEFKKNALTDAGNKVLEVMQLGEVVGSVKQQGFKLLKKVTEFELPSTSWPLIEVGGAFKIYIEYAANAIGTLDYDVNSFAADVADTWKSRMANVALVVDLGPIDRLMTIKGHWDAKKGAEAAYKGSDTDPDFPSPQIEFAPALKPVIEILQILQDLQTGDYKDVFAKGLQLAMSNKAGSWEYKFEASKEIPVVRFPPGEAYNSTIAPLKLEAGLKLGAYFNAALKATSDPNQLLPTAGASVGFYGRLSVMCLTISAATVYAVGQVNLDIAADTAGKPSLRMKFGFGAQIVVGLPVVGNVSVLYMVGVEIYTETGTVAVSAFMLFQGHAELLGGIVGVTITIEAKGTVTRIKGPPDRTDLSAQVTFAIDISIFLVIDINFSTSWEEQRQIA